jgi:hypothetical protein
MLWRVGAWWLVPLGSHGSALPLWPLKDRWVRLFQLAADSPTGQFSGVKL